MGVRALAPVGAVLDQLLRVVHRAAARGHGDGEEDARDDRPDRSPPSISGLMIPTMIRNTTGIRLGTIMFLIAAPVTMFTVRPYSGLPVPARVGDLAEHRRTSCTTLTADSTDGLHGERRE